MSQLYAISDPWLAGILSFPVSRIVLSDTAPAGSVVVSDVLAGQGFQYAKLPANAVATAQALEDLGFRYVDIALQFGMSATEFPRDVLKGGVRTAETSDCDAVADLARRNFVWSRFHQDPFFDCIKANEIKAQWAENYFSGNRGEHMVVAENEGRLVGFLQLLRSGNDDLVIDLIAVDQRARRNGLAAAMVGYAIQAYGPIGQLQVGTQAANADSVRFYQKLGFRLMSTNLVLHRHGIGGVV